jgi:hypothetical protein
MCARLPSRNRGRGGKESVLPLSARAARLAKDEPSPLVCLNAHLEFLDQMVGAHGRAAI